MALNVVSEFRFSLHFELFDHYTYNSYVKIRPIDWYPVDVTVNYEFYDNLYIAMTA